MGGGVINGESVLSGLNVKKMLGLSFPGTKQTVHNNEVFALSGCTAILRKVVG